MSRADEAELSVHELGGLSVQEIEAKLQESFTKAEAIPKSGSFQMYELKYITE